MTDLSPAKIALPVPRGSVDRVGVVSLVVGTAIIAWSGVLARFLDVGPLAGAAWRMGLALPVLAVWARVLQHGRTSSLALRPVAGLLILAGCVLVRLRASPRRFEQRLEDFARQQPRPNRPNRSPSEADL